MIDFGRLIPGLSLPKTATPLEGELELMRRMISNGIHIAGHPSAQCPAARAYVVQNPMSLDLDPTPYRFRLIFAKEEPLLTVSRWSATDYSVRVS